MKPRLDSIDLLRGLVMVLMALDHVRDFFMTNTVNPVGLDQTTPALFFTRWISHFCAPTFLLLAGVGAALSRQRGKTPGTLSWFLLTRGLWMIVLEWCVVRTFGWAFNFDFTYLPCWVIWTLGWSMILLAGLIHLPVPVTVGLGLALLAGHHLVDHLRGEQWGGWGWLWHILHDPRALVLTPSFSLVPAAPDLNGVTLAAGYPLLPWVGVMAVGYGLGFVYAWEATARRRLFWLTGLACCGLFVGLRWVNGYGETQPWEAQSTTLGTVMAFLNCTKQPPSLCFLLMTLGPALLFLAWFDRGVGRWAGPLVTFGRVPLFFYLLHLPLIHGLCVVAAWGQGGAFPAWLFHNPPLGEMPAGFGFSLIIVYGVWLLVVVVLYPLCRGYAAFKQQSRAWWVSYV